jgi:hypothetical protein
VAWLAPLTGGDGGALCQRHAERFAVPRGWWLNDRRQDATLFSTRTAPASVETPKPVRARRRRRAVVPATPTPEPIDESLPLDEATESPVVEQGWAWRVASMGDLDGLLNARTPLLARAFKQPGTAGERPPTTAEDAAS